ncbi:MAG TPA: ester cyclase [Mycobacteriales bacterium]|nr:ester cyclase [Mycobacteriales bacterium]
MSAEQNKTLYRRWLMEVWNDANYDVASELLAEDLIDHTPMEGQPKGREGDLWAARMIRAAFPDMKFEPVVVFADDEYVAGRWTMTATHTGEFAPMGVPPTGRPVKMGGQEIFKVRDGKLAEVWHVEEEGSMLTQLGLGPPPRPLIRMMAKRSAKQYRRMLRKSR